MKDLKSLKCLLPETQKILITLIKNDYLSKFVLVGGSALSIRLCHRYSEDLDFFTYSNDYNLDKIRNLIDKFKEKEIINLTKEQIDFMIKKVRVTFFNAKWEFLKPEIVQNFNLATLEQIAVMKTNTLFLRAKYRDYYDMYFLVKKLGIKKVFESSRKILKGLNFKVFATALLYIDDIKDENIEHLQPIKRINLKEIRNYFEEEIKTQIFTPTPP